MKRTITHGFTLIEIMVAVAVSAAIILFSSSVANVALRSWNKDGGRLRNNIEARAVFDTLATDLRTAIFRQSETEWLRVTYDKAVGRATTYQIPQTPWIRFFVPALDRDETAGTLSAISYRVAFDDPVEANGPHPVFGLYRAITDPEKTHLQAFGSPETVQTFWRERQASTTAPGNLVASNVIDFDLVLWYWPEENRRLGTIDSNTRKPKRLPTGTSLRVVGMHVETEPAVPDLRHVSQLYAADIDLTILTDKGSLELGRNHASNKDIIQRHGYRYGGRVEFLTTGACLP